jgi:hypothetical protein
MRLQYAMTRTSAGTGDRTMHQKMQHGLVFLCGEPSLYVVADEEFAHAALMTGYRVRCEECDAAAVEKGLAAYGAGPEAVAHPTVARAVETLRATNAVPAVMYDEFTPGANGFSIQPLTGGAIVVVHLARGNVVVPSLHGFAGVLEGYRRTLQLGGWYVMPAPEWQVLAQRGGIAADEPRPHPYVVVFRGDI